MSHLTPLWIGVIIVAFIVALINFGMAAARLARPLAATVRGVAGLLSLGVAVGVVVAKNFALSHPYLDARFVFLGFGVFVFAVLFLPSYVDRSVSASAGAATPTLQERAARPANATVRLRDAKSASDEWVN